MGGVPVGSPDLQPDLNAVNRRLQGFQARPDEWLILTGAT